MDRFVVFGAESCTSEGLQNSTNMQRTSADALELDRIGAKPDALTIDEDEIQVVSCLPCENAQTNFSCGAVETCIEDKFMYDIPTSVDGRMLQSV